MYIVNNSCFCFRNLTTNKLFCCDTEAEQVLLLRHFIDMKKTKMLLQKRRPHVLVEKLEVADDDVCLVLFDSAFLQVDRQF